MSGAMSPTPDLIHSRDNECAGARRGRGQAIRDADLGGEIANLQLRHMLPDRRAPSTQPPYQADVNLTDLMQKWLIPFKI